MNSCKLPQGSTVYARLRLNSLRDGGNIFVDKNKNNLMDLGPKSLSEDKRTTTRLNSEPLMTLTMQELKDYASLNGHQELLTREDLGDLTTLQFKKEVTKPKSWFSGETWKHTKSPTEETLTDIAHKLSTLSEGKKDVQWAIDPQTGNQYEAELYLYSPPARQSV